MTDPTPVAKPKGSAMPATVTLWLLSLWTIIVLCKFAIVGLAMNKLDPTTLGFLATAENTTQNLLLMAVSFWVGATVGSRAQGDSIAESSKAGQDALATLAGAPPAKPAPTQPTAEASDQ